MSTGLFLRRRESTSTVCSISCSRPITGSISPLRAIAVRSRPYSSSVGVLDGGPAGPALPAACAADGLLQGLRRDAPLAQEPPARRVRVDRQREQQVFGTDVGGAQRSGDLVGVEQGALGRGGEGRRLGARLAATRQAVELGAQLRRVGARAADQLPGGLLLGHRPQQVVGVEVRAAHLGGPARGRVHQFPGLLAEELGDVDALAGLASAAHVAGEEVVEGAAVRAWEVSAGHRSSVPGVAWSPTALLVLGRDLYRSSCRGGRPWAVG